MGTAEILIVFSALMALIALVTIGIDWIGKPLKHRRFIPRMYRFEDEKLPTDAYGNTDFKAAIEAPTPQVTVPSTAVIPPTGAMPVGPPPSLTSPPVDYQQRPMAPRQQPAPKQVARLDPVVRSNSAFSDSLAANSPSSSTVPSTSAAVGDGRAHDVIAGTEQPEAPAAPWSAGHDLDQLNQGRKPTLAIKAERFWKTVAHDLGDSHFSDDDRQRMESGKAPRRTNPRTGRVEAMQLGGLRRASRPEDVEMSWPDEAIDPWNAS